MAGGVMRLRTRAVRVGGDEEGSGYGGAKRLARSGDREGGGGEVDERRVVCCGGGEVGRLAMDWLAWSGQLGCAPTRVLCLMPEVVGDGVGEGGDGSAASLGERLAGAWPRAGLDVVVDDDPVGATLSRLRRSGRVALASGVGDGRSSLRALTNRPGRAHRSLYRWGALAIAGAALLIGAFGWQVRGAVSSARERAETLRAQTRAELAAFEEMAPDIVGHTHPVGRLEALINELRGTEARIDPPMPVLREMARVLEVVGEYEGVKLTQVQLGEIAAVVRMEVPDAATGPEIVLHLRETPGRIEWRGASGRASGDQRVYILTGLWAREGEPRARGWGVGGGFAMGGGG